MTNAAFLEQYAAPGRIGLAGGITLIDRVICRAERHVDEAARWSKWSHAFVFEGRRLDGHHWLIESDLDVHRKHIRLGVQENRLTKYHDESLYTVLAVLDFSLSEEQAKCALSQGLELVANRTRYSVRELLGTLIALRHPSLRSRENVLAREQSLYCSALVRHLFLKAGVDLLPEIDLKNTTPEDLTRSPSPHTTYLLEREIAASKLRKFALRVRRRVRARIRVARRVAASTRDS